jgi:L-cystine transport system substrate-binding protein
MKKRVFVSIALGMILGAGLLVGCSNSNNEKASTDSGVREVAVGVGSTFPPYAYIDKNNEPAGYDVAVLKEINKRLPKYKFNYQSIELKNLLISLDAKKISIATQQFEKNPSRAEKYLFANEGFANYDKRIVVAKGNTNIKTIDDLAEKRVGCSQGSNTAAILEKYNQDHDKKITIVYTSGGESVVYDDLVNGRLDALVMTRKVFNRTNAAFGNGLDIVEDNLFSQSDAYFILSKKEEQLRDDIDTALKAMKQDGTLSKISQEYTNSDYNAE